MTVNFSELRTKEVINIEDGERLGFVSDITLDTMSGKISSISVPGAYKLLGLIGREDDKVIPWENIKKIGDDLIIVEGDKNQCSYFLIHNKQMTIAAYIKTTFYIVLYFHMQKIFFIYRKSGRPAAFSV